MWLSLVERYVRDVEVASSNLVISTKKQESALCALLFFADMTIMRICITQSELARIELIVQNLVISTPERAFVD